MSGPTSLKSQKALLTRYCNNLASTVEKSKELSKLEILALRDATIRAQVQTQIFELNATSKLVDDSLATFTATVDSLIDTLNAEQEAQAQEYIDKAHTSLDNARSLAIDLEAKMYSAHDQMNFEADKNVWEGQIMAKPKLPAIPIPIFSGKAWQFENFWTLFEANVNSQPLTKLQKFNYLISALRGEARETIQRYPISEENYDLALDLLRNKYGDEFKLISSLQHRLEGARAENNSIPAQRKLLEYLIPIIAQLQKKGVDLKGSFTSQKILSKFIPSIQRKTLEQKMEGWRTEEDWRINELLEELDKQITKEERINGMVTEVKIGRNNKIRENPPNQNPIVPVCLFCKSTWHRSMFCSKYATIEQRRKFFEENKRCYNCAKEGHSSKQCTAISCKLCSGKKHHHTLCPVRARKEVEKVDKRTIFSREKPTRTNFSTQNTRAKPVRAQRPNATVATAHPISTSECENTQELDTHMESIAEEEHKATVFHNQESEINSADTVLLLTGSARVKDEKHNIWKEIEILFDTGADRSFISLALARDLGLESPRSQDLIMYTFGSTEPKSTRCGVTTLELWDQQNKKHKVHLCATPILVTKGKTAHLTEADKQFIARNNLTLSKTPWNEEIHPQILLGCDQLWNFLDAPNPKFSLPSGLQLIPSKLGYLLCGKQHPEELQKKEIETQAEAVVNTLVNFDDELMQWDKYWTIDSSGVCEFTGTKNAEKEAVNEKVQRFFDETIQKRADGYYVRFPYKENHPPLPTNEAIARKRLTSVLSSLKLKPNILSEYEKIFQDQLEKGIIEEIPNLLPAQGLLHYIPHQPVVTPKKETTKVRIVFDASSHYKQCPSLNDILHQGPLILPDIISLLLRFRIPAYAITADVEKAFLQVHLHEEDRDVTRFFWVHDVTLPAEGDNIKTMRFTRVTFGLNVSPFLLGRTIQFHLEHFEQDHELAQEIRENLYVDNLILSAQTVEDAKIKALRARNIFEEMRMNLREFASNAT
ncbi:unnamed protein product, partial [Cylicostephanus goldi]